MTLNLEPSGREAPGLTTVPLLVRTVISALGFNPLCVMFYELERVGYFHVTSQHSEQYKEVMSVMS